MPVAWYDDKKNSPGKLSSKLATDAQILNGLTSGSVGLILMALAAFIAGPIIAFFYSWELTLLSLGLSPLLLWAAKI